ncbi:helix-turn-helix transcriptional regulator [Proteus terrae]|uniref:helix-turn-helix transcriptional regulator n=1 Tax=Proteus terrae TaxID=1574161 RepID=UPI000D68B926|nr:HTH domain-containing protein [Proteus terrae]
MAQEMRDRQRNEARHDRLAMRLSLIISRLLTGETLSLKALSDEFGVSERTLQRDFNQRLSHIDLVSDKEGYRLSGRLIAWRPPDIFTFLQKVGLSRYFLGLTRKAVNHLPNSDIHYPCLAWHTSIETHPTNAECFYCIIAAITSTVDIRIQQTDSEWLQLTPYRLVLQGAHWYLIACIVLRLVVIPLDKIQTVHITEIMSCRRQDICQLSQEDNFIQGLPYFDSFQRTMKCIDY